VLGPTWLKGCHSVAACDVHCSGWLLDAVAAGNGNDEDVVVVTAVARESDELACPVLVVAAAAA